MAVLGSDFSVSAVELERSRVYVAKERVDESRLFDTGAALLAAFMNVASEQ